MGERRLGRRMAGHIEDGGEVLGACMVGVVVAEGKLED